MGAYVDKEGSEHVLRHALLASVADGNLLLAGRYYLLLHRDCPAASTWRGVDIVFQQHQLRMTDFRTGRRLGARDHVVSWNKPKVKPPLAQPGTLRGGPQTLHVRETQVGNKVLVNTLLSSTQASAPELKRLYTQRWNVELDLRHIKTTLSLDQMTFKTPAMSEKQ